jgi:hypothetical protein
MSCPVEQDDDGYYIEQEDGRRIEWEELDDYCRERCPFIECYRQDLVDLFAKHVPSEQGTRTV